MWNLEIYTFLYLRAVWIFILSNNYEINEIKFGNKVTTCFTGEIKIIFLKLRRIKEIFDYTNYTLCNYICKEWNRSSNSR